MGKSGGHGVGWTEIPTYFFDVPDGAEEVPVSIADGGGTEIDLRFKGDRVGACQVVLAPVARFADFPAGASIVDLGPPDRMVKGFAPELLGAPLEDRQILSTTVVDKADDGLPYYQFEVSTPLVPHGIIAMTAYKGRVFILATSQNATQHRRYPEAWARAAESFRCGVGTGQGIEA